MSEEESALMLAEEKGIVNVDFAMEEWNAYQDLTKKLLNENDYQKIGTRQFKKKSGWRKYMRAFNISTTVIGKEINRDEDGRVIDANFMVKAIMPDGRFAEGFGNCSKFERQFNKGNHDIPATAMTRATNRAISDLIGAGEVSAEEMSEEKGKRTRPPRPSREQVKNDEVPDGVDPDKVEDAKTTTKKGRGPNKKRVLTNDEITHLKKKNTQIWEAIDTLQAGQFDVTLGGILKELDQVFSEEGMTQDEFNQAKKDLRLK